MTPDPGPAATLRSLAQLAADIAGLVCVAHPTGPRWFLTRGACRAHMREHGGQR